MDIRLGYSFDEISRQAQATRLLIEWDRNCGETLCEDDRWRRCIATFSHIVAFATWLMRHVRLGAPLRAERAVKGDLHTRRHKALFSDFKQYKTSAVRLCRYKARA